MPRTSSRPSPGTYDGSRTTGFASPAGDDIGGRIDLSQTLDLESPSRYLVVAADDEMAERSILQGDYLVVDADTPPADGRVAIVMMAGEALVGELRQRGNEWTICARSPGARPRVIDEDAEIWGTVVSLIRQKV